MRRGSSLILLLLLLAGISCATQTTQQKDAAAQKMNAMSLIDAAQRAYSSGRTADAGFYLLAFNARMRIDKQVFPPVGKGGDSPGVLAGALKATLGATIMKSLEADPTAFSEAINRITVWKPEFPTNYDPGWKYQNKLEGQKLAAAVKAETQKVLAPIVVKQKTLANDEYRKLLQVVADADKVIKEHFQNTGGAKPAATPQQVAAFREASAQRKKAALRLMQLEWELAPETRWHAKVGWKAEDYFDDLKVIALCQAIEVNDVKKMEELIAAGANASAIGKEGMTPLLWALPDRQFERFECLLKHGADPNVHIQSDFGTGNAPFHPGYQGRASLEDHGCKKGESVTLLACRSPFSEYFNLVMKYGGDPNDIEAATDRSPLDIVINGQIPDVLERTQTLVQKGANVNRYCRYRFGFPLMHAIYERRFDVALFLIDSGADPDAAPPDKLEGAIHLLAIREEDIRPYVKDEQKKELDDLIAAFAKRGLTLEKARQEEAEWRRQMGGVFDSKKIAERRKKLIVERDAQRAKAKEQKN